METSLVSFLIHFTDQGFWQEQAEMHSQMSYRSQRGAESKAEQGEYGECKI